MPSRPVAGRLGVLLLAVFPTLAGAQPVGSEFRVNTYTTGNQQSYGIRLVSADAAGDFVVVWTSYRQDGHREGVFGQRYDSVGAPLGAEFQVNSYTTERQASPSIAASADGSFVVVWDSRNQDGSNLGVFGQRYDGNGVPRGSEFRVNSYTTDLQYGPSVAQGSDGSFLVVWTSWQGPEATEVQGQRYDSAGGALGAEFRVNSYTTGFQELAAAASLGDGGFVVVWVGDSLGVQHGIIGQRFDSQGIPLGTEFRVNSYTIQSQTFPSVASDASGNFVVVWQNGDQDGQDFGIFGQRFDSAGMPQGNEFQVNTYTTDHQMYPCVASDAGGNFVVAWQSYHQDGSNNGIFAQRYDSSGAPHGHEFLVNTFTNHAQARPSVGALGERLFAVVWQSDLQDGSGEGVFGQRIDLGGDTIPPSVSITAPNGGETLFTGSPYLIQWTASDDTGLGSFDAFFSVDGGGVFTPIAECQDVPGSATSCLWLAPGPPSESALVRVVAEDTSGNRDSDDSNRVFDIVSGMASITVESPNTNVDWQVGTLQSIEWTHNLGVNARFRIDLDRDDDGSYEDLIDASEAADSDTSGSRDWWVNGAPSAMCRIRLSWTGSPTVADASDVTFRITPAPWPDFQINTYNISSQGTFSDHVVATDASGDFVVVWQSSLQDGDFEGVFGQRYDSAGGRLGAEFRVNSHTTSRQNDPSVAADADGNFIVVWQSHSQDGDNYGIFAQRYDSAGETLGAEFQVNSGTNDDQLHASVASDASGNFVVVWTSEADDNVRGQRYDSMGNARGSEFRVNSYTTGYQYAQSVASDPNGNSVVVWASAPSYHGSGRIGIFAQRYDSEGAARGAEFQVTPQFGPASVASDASGNFVAVWSSGQDDDDVFGQRYDPAGVPLGQPFLVNATTAADQQLPSVASDASGNFVVAWQSDLQDGSSTGVFGQRYDSGGAPQGGEFQISSFTTGAQDRASVGATGTDQFIVVWTSANQDGDLDGVFGRRFDFGADEITIVSPNTDVRWRIGSPHKIQWTHSLGSDATFRIELDRNDDGDYEELIAAAAPVDAARGQFVWVVSGPRSGTARVRVSWTAKPEVSDTSDVTFQIRPGG